MTGVQTCALPISRRLDELAARIDSGQVAVRTPELDRRIKSVERSVGRLGSSIVFAGLLVAGVFLRPSDEVLGSLLMWASAVPLLHVAFTWRSK